MWRAIELVETLCDCVQFADQDEARQSVALLYCRQRDWLYRQMSRSDPDGTVVVVVMTCLCYYIRASEDGYQRGFFRALLSKGRVQAELPAHFDRRQVVRLVTRLFWRTELQLDRLHSGTIHRHRDACIADAALHLLPALFGDSSADSSSLLLLLERVRRAVGRVAMNLFALDSVEVHRPGRSTAAGVVMLCVLSAWRERAAAMSPRDRCLTAMNACERYAVNSNPAVDWNTALALLEHFTRDLGVARLLHGTVFAVTT